MTFLHRWMRTVLWVLFFSIPMALAGCQADARGPRAAGKLQVHFINVGQGDAELIIAPSGKCGLIDGGEADAGPAVVTFLKSKKVKRLEFILASHPHSDHIGGLQEALKNFPVGRYCDIGYEYASPVYRDLLADILERKIEYQQVRRGSVIVLDSAVKLQILWPPENLFSGKRKIDVNDNSAVARMQYGSVAFLFAGDIGHRAINAMLDDDPALQAQVLKVPHHGSRQATNKRLLQAVGPEIAIISSGRGNSYKHPHQETLDLLDAAGVKLYRTDGQGDISVVCDGKNYSVSADGRSFTVRTRNRGNEE